MMARDSPLEMTPVINLTPRPSISSEVLRTHAAGSPWVSSKKNSTCRPSMPPLAFTVFANSRHVRWICDPRADQLPVMPVGTPIRTASFVCAHAG
ncbi:hypothetical protein D3C71_998330 [compost metagenome]